MMDMQLVDTPQYPPATCESVCQELERNCVKAGTCHRTGFKPRFQQRADDFIARHSQATKQLPIATVQPGITVGTPAKDRRLAETPMAARLGITDAQLSVVLAHPLYEVLLQAIVQAAYGKGERHGGASKPFLEQPWHALAEQHGIGFLTGQAAKKLGEAAAGKTGADWLREVLGSVVYIGMSLLFHHSKSGLKSDKQ